MSRNSAPLSAQIHAAFEWWHNAGVDLEFEDDATDWLDKPEPAKAKRAAKPSADAVSAEEQQKPPTKVDILGANPPQDLASFREWWLNEPMLDAVGVRRRIPPQGVESARLMVLIMTPEEVDSSALLTGEQGNLLDGFLRAAGLARENIYLASVLPRYTPLADPSSLKSAGYGEVLLHHIKLARPQRLLVLGMRILPLLEHGAAQESGILQNVKHEGGSLPLLAVDGLDSMLSMPKLKARFWHKWLDWTKDSDD